MTNIHDLVLVAGKQKVPVSMKELRRQLKRIIYSKDKWHQTVTLHARRLAAKDYGQELEDLPTMSIRSCILAAMDYIKETP